MEPPQVTEMNVQQLTGIGATDNSGCDAQENTRRESQVVSSDRGDDRCDVDRGQLSLGEWKSQLINKQVLSTRDRLRHDYAKQAAQIKIGDRCSIAGFSGVVAFLGDEIEGLPGGFWVGIVYDQPVGKNDGTVKGKRLFTCSPNCGHLVRPDKVLQGSIATQATTPSSGAKPTPAATPSSAGRPSRPWKGLQVDCTQATSPSSGGTQTSTPSSGEKPTPAATPSPAESPSSRLPLKGFRVDCTQGSTPSSGAKPTPAAATSSAQRPSSRLPCSPPAVRLPIDSSSDEETLLPPPRLNPSSLSSTVRQGVSGVFKPPVLVCKPPPQREVVDAGSNRYAKWQNIDPNTVIGTAPELDDTLPRHRTGLVYDARMEEHRNPIDSMHPEQPLRITAIFAALVEQGLAQRCCRVPARAATEAELVTVHTAQHVQNVCTLVSKSQGELNGIAATFNSVYLCPKSTSAALLAAGSVIEATRMVCQGKIANACCVVRPPGHHALPSCAMGFCLIGNVAVAAKEACMRGWAKRVLILDWDIHHGNGTQRIFWEDASVLCFSVHRFERGHFFPGGPEGNNSWVGEGDGQGYNVNVPWPKAGAGDEEYKTVMDELFRPIAAEFKPDLVLVSAGFDAAQGDPLGACKVTPAGYYMMTKVCKEFAHGKVVLALEGGYSLRATGLSMAACVSALLNSSKDLQPPASKTEGTPSRDLKPAASKASNASNASKTEDSFSASSPASAAHTSPQAPPPVSPPLGGVGGGSRSEGASLSPLPRLPSDPPPPQDVKRLPLPSGGGVPPRA